MELSFKLWRNWKARSAFTLIEMLVAISILSLLVVMTSSAYQVVLSGYTRIADQSRQREEARTVLLLMGNEIRESLTPVSRSPGLVVANMGSKAPGLDFLINPPNLAASASGKAYANPHTLFWQVSAADGEAGSALIGYAVKWETRADGTPIPVLRRLKSDSGRMFQELTDAASMLATDPTSTWVRSTLLKDLAPATTASAFKGWMADHILTLWVRPLDPVGNPITRTARRITGTGLITSASALPFNVLGSSQTNSASFDSKLGYAYSTTTTPSNNIERFAPALPAAVEIAIVSVPPSALKRLKSPVLPDTNLGVNSASFWEDIDEYLESLPAGLKETAKVYSTIVSLDGAQ